MYNRFLKVWEWIKEESDLIMAGIVFCTGVVLLVTIMSWEPPASCG